VGIFLQARNASLSESSPPESDGWLRRLEHARDLGGRHAVGCFEYDLGAQNWPLGQDPALGPDGQSGSLVIADGQGSGGTVGH
jgi:hypothetical protein